jgi:ATPase subunit of ABC transporter with duplicated ATPase domains
MATVEELRGDACVARLNHLDIDSIEASEAGLRLRWRAAVVGYDEAFLETIGTKRPQLPAP